MTTLKFEKKKMPGANLGKASRYPILLNERAFVVKKTDAWEKLDETDGLFIGYGSAGHALPFTEQEAYDRDEGMKEFDCAIIENDYIRAEFMPGLGGRMWSLYDKVGKRDLVVDNPIFRPCALAIRNAWFCGGAEYNCCSNPSHHPMTCDKIYAASYTAADGTPALRLYNFERISGMNYQIDVFLPDESRQLFARVRIVNDTDKVKPMYWYTNIAAKQEVGARVIVPCSRTYVNKLGIPVYKTPVPMVDGMDTSYPTNHKECIDHFFDIPENQRKWEAYVDKDGNGLMFASTALLKGRKMFIWGDSTGGNNWQKLLTNEAGFDQPYIELQGGLTTTQEGAKPMPPHTAWEWVESYSAINMKPEEVHGEYTDAVANVEKWLDANIPQKQLDDLLASSKADALKKAKLEHAGYPWGKLENVLREARGKKPSAEHLEYGELDEEQKVWADFLKNKKLVKPDPSETPKSYMVQDEWFHMLKEAVRDEDSDNWYAWYNLGLGYFAREDYLEAADAFACSLELKMSSWANHALGCTYLSMGEYEDGVAYLIKALYLDPNDMGLAKEVIRLAYTFGYYDEAMALFKVIPEDMFGNLTLKAYKAMTDIHLGNYEAGKAVLDEMAKAPIPDLREGDETITKAYIFAVQKIAEKEGKTIAAEDVEVPVGMDYRMYPLSKK